MIVFNSIYRVLFDNLSFGNLDTAYVYVVSNSFPPPRMFGQGAIEYDPLIYKHEKQHPKEKKKR